MCWWSPQATAQVKLLGPNIQVAYVKQTSTDVTDPLISVVMLTVIIALDVQSVRWRGWEGLHQSKLVQVSIPEWWRIFRLVFSLNTDCKAVIKCLKRVINLHHLVSLQAAATLRNFKKTNFESYLNSEALSPCGMLWLTIPIHSFFYINPHLCCCE